MNNLPPLTQRALAVLAELDSRDQTNHELQRAFGDYTTDPDEEITKVYIRPELLEDE